MRFGTRPTANKGGLVSSQKQGARTELDEGTLKKSPAQAGKDAGMSEFQISTASALAKIFEAKAAARSCARLRNINRLQMQSATKS